MEQHRLWQRLCARCSLVWEPWSRLSEPQRPRRAAVRLGPSPRALQALQLSLVSCGVLQLS